MAEDIVIGIDLGTTNCCMAAVVNGEVRIIQNSEGENTTPSMISFKNGERIVGQLAKEYYSTKFEENVIYDSKRIIGRTFDDHYLQKHIKTWPFKVVDVKNNPMIRIEDKTVNLYKPEEIYGMILQKLKRDAEAYFGKEIKKAVITVPANFNVTQKQATMDAGKLAGLEVLKLVVEPTAAAIAYGFHKKTSTEKNILVYDLGGGTFDVSILKVKENNFEVLATGGDTFLGGQDFDNNVVENILKNNQDKMNGSSKHEKLIRRRLAQKCEKGKKVISTATNTIIVLDALFDSDINIGLSRKRFEFWNQELFDKTIDIVNKTLQEVNFTPDSIDEVVLVGGSTRIPKIQELLSTFFNGKTLQKVCNPDLDIARGAALYAETLISQSCQDKQDDAMKIEQKKSMYLSDVLPVSIGIADAKGIMVKVIHKNTKYPSKQVQGWMTTSDYQTCMYFDIYEGEHEEASKNHYLGQLKLENFPMKKKGEVKFDTTLAIDENGILKVNAIERNTKLSANIKISYIGGRMPLYEVERFDAESEKYRETQEKRTKVLNKKLELEEYCLNVISKVKDDVSGIDECEKYIILNECNDTLTWIDQNAEFELKQLVIALKRLKLLCKGFF